MADPLTEVLAAKRVALDESHSGTATFCSGELAIVERGVAELRRKANALDWLEAQSEVDIWMRGLPAEDYLARITIGDNDLHSGVGKTLLAAIEDAIAKEKANG